jgi:hypothetical protein
MSSSFGPSDNSAPNVECDSVGTEVEMQGRVIVADHAQLDAELVSKRYRLGLVQTQEPRPVDLGRSAGLSHRFFS